MKKIWFVVENANGEELSKNVETLSQAKRELKRIKKEDLELGYDEDEVNAYCITRYIETDVAIYNEAVN